MKQGRLLLQLLDIIIEYLSESKETYSPEIIKLLSVARSLLLKNGGNQTQDIKTRIREEDKNASDNQKALEIAKALNLNDPGKSRLMKAVKDKLDEYTQIIQNSRQFQIQLKEATDKAEQKNISQNLKNISSGNND